MQPGDARLGVAPSPAPLQPAGHRVADDLQPQLRGLALAVGEVVPGLGLVVAGLEVGGVRPPAPRRPAAVSRLLRVPLDLGPARLSRVLVLGIHREVGMVLVAVHAQLHHLPIALVQPGAPGQVVVVVEVVQPVLEPQPAVGVLLRAAVHHVRVARLLAQLDVAAAVVANRRADQVLVVGLRVVGVPRVPQEVQCELLLAGLRVGGGDQRTLLTVDVLAAQHVAGVVGPLRGGIGEEGLLRVVAQLRLEPAQKLIVVHAATLTGRTRPWFAERRRMNRFLVGSVLAAFTVMVIGMGVLIAIDTSTPSSTSA